MADKQLKLKGYKLTKGSDLQGQVQAFKEILRWRRILDSEPVGILADQIEEILRKKGFVQ